MAQVTLQQKIASLYIGIFNRAPDSSGLNYWVNLAQSSGANDLALLKQMAGGFAANPIFTKTYSDLLDADFVKAVYQNILGAVGDSAGISYWQKLLNNGMSRSDMVAQFMHDAMLIDLESFIAANPSFNVTDKQAAYDKQNYILNKTLVAVSYSTILAGYSNINTTIYSDITQSPSYLASVYILQGVTSDAQTVSTKISFINAMCNLSNPIQGILDAKQADVLLANAQENSITQTGINANSLLASTAHIIRSLNSNSVWGTNISYGYNASIPNDYYGIKADSTIYKNLTTAWQSASSPIRTAYDQVMSALSDIIEAQVSYTTGTADIRINMVPTIANVAAFAYFPSNAAIGGDVFIDRYIATTSSNLSDGGYGLFTLIHELGHALGLKHPFEDGEILTSIEDNRVNTVMSYTGFHQDIPVFSSSKAQVSVSFKMVYPAGFMIYDIAALQSMYGVDKTTHIDNTVYSFGTNPFYQTIWDAGGMDTLDFSLTTHGNTIRLNAGSFSDVNYRSLATQIAEQQATYREQGIVGQDAFVANALNKYASSLYTGEHALAIAYGAVIENAIGGSADDVFYDSAVDNKLVGGLGNDVFYEGAGGYDTVDGGDGVDNVVLTQTKAQVSISYLLTGDVLVQTTSYAIKLVSIEQIEFSDQFYML